MTLDVNQTDEKIHTTLQQEYKILSEYKMIESEKIGGVYVIPSYNNSLLWYGVIFVRQGFYKDGIFRFTILLSDKFPNDKTPPNIIFQSEIFHPLVCPFTGSLDILSAFPIWRTGEDHVWQVLKYIQSVFLDPLESIRFAATNSTSGKLNNADAAELLTQNRAEFIARVNSCVQLSKDRLYDDPPTDEDPHYITFEQWNPEVHEPVKDRIRLGKDLSNTCSTVSSGLSWMKEGDFKPLSKD